VLLFLYYINSAIELLIKVKNWKKKYVNSVFFRAHQLSELQKSRSVSQIFSKKGSVSQFLKVQSTTLVFLPPTNTLIKNNTISPNKKCCAELFLLIVS